MRRVLLKRRINHFRSRRYQPTLHNKSSPTPPLIHKRFLQRNIRSGGWRRKLNLIPLPAWNSVNMCLREPGCRWLLSQDNLYWSRNRMALGMEDARKGLGLWFVATSRSHMPWRRHPPRHPHSRCFVPFSPWHRTRDGTYKHGMFRRPSYMQHYMAESERRTSMVTQST